MGSYSIEGIGYAAGGYEEDYAEIDGKTIGICGLVRAAGGASIDWALATAMEYYDDPHWECHRAELNGAPHPPAYRLRFTVEVERLPDAEAAAFWKSKRQEIPPDDEPLTR